MHVSNVIVLYFVIGAVMFGGGAVTWDDSGVTAFFVDLGPEGQVSPDAGPEDRLSGVSGAITSLVGEFGGPIVLVWNLVIGLISFIHWPLVVCIEHNVPPRVTVLLGGTPTAMFYMALIILVKGSA